MLLVDNIWKTYGNKSTVESVSLNVGIGEIVGLLGPNGAGKTTIFHMITGIIRPNFGDVYLDGIKINNFPTYIRAIKGLIYLPQEASVFKELTVKENILIVLEYLEIDDNKKKKLLNNSLKELRIIDLSDRKAGDLSGGERRRLEIARSLILKPKIVLLDEPFAGVDPLAVIDIVNIVRYLKKKKISILISDHNVKETLEVCDSAYILSRGKIVEGGSPSKIIASSVVRKLYLGNSFII